MRAYYYTTIVASCESLWKIAPGNSMCLLKLGSDMVTPKQVGLFLKWYYTSYKTSQKDRWLLVNFMWKDNMWPTWNRIWFEFIPNQSIRFLIMKDYVLSTLWQYWAMAQILTVTVFVAISRKKGVAVGALWWLKCTLALFDSKLPDLVSLVVHRWH